VLWLFGKLLRLRCNQFFVGFSMMMILQKILTDETVVLLAACGCGGAIAYFVLSLIIKARAMQKMALQDEIIVAQTDSGVLRVSLPVARAIGYWMTAVWSKPKGGGFFDHWVNSVRQQLSAAGNPHGLRPDEYIGFYPVWIVVGAMSGMISHIAAPVFPMDSYIAVMACGGALLWRSWLLSKMRRRQLLIRRALPFSLDILTLAMEAGLDFTAALNRMAGKLSGTPLGQEYALLIHEIQLGKSRADALRDFSARVDVTEVRTVVASLIQADELGAPIGPVLRIQASQQRERRSHSAEEMAMKAPVKMLFPLVFFIFPTTFITLAGLIYLALS